MSTHTLRPYVLSADGDMLWRKDYSYRIAIVLWLPEMDSYMLTCVHCTEGHFTSRIRREAADLAYQHFIAKHTTLTDEGLTA
jgi:hypothetical protein